MPHTYPLMLDVADRLVVIVGGGKVAVRKAKGLLHCGAKRVWCVSPEFHSEMPGEVMRFNERYDSRHLVGANLVFAATNDAEVNSSIVRDCRERGILVNRADGNDDLSGDFSTPALFRDGAATVTVSAGSPALAATIRDGIRERWENRWTQMADAMQTLRPIITSRQELTDARRHDVFRDLATSEAMNVLADGGIDALRRWLANRFPEIGGGAHA